ATVVNTPYTKRRALEKLEQTREMSKAISENQFYIEYQPRFDLREKKVTSIEALLRWNHPERGIIPPGEFIPLAEESGLIDPLGQWVLQQAMRETKPLVKQLHIRLSVNVSVIQIMQPHFIHFVKQLLEGEMFPPEFLEFEITETAISHSENVMLDFIQAANKLGIQVSLDDFGVGYSSLNFI